MSETLTIEKLVHGGMGLARTEKGVVFVADVLPGETVRVKITGTKAGSPVATVVELLEPSPHRREPFCPLAGVCGGCNWQHVEYAEQLRIKKEIFTDCLRRIGRLREFPEPVMHAAEERGYRCRTQFKVDRDTGDIGFYRRKSNDVVRVDSCPLLVPALDRLLREQERLREAIPQGTEQIKAIAGSNGAVASCPVLAPLAEKRTVIMLGGKKFVLRGDGFFQGNALLTESLACWAKPWVQGEFFVDMYGGVGLFALSLAEKFARGMLIEESRSLVKQAQANFRQNAIAHVKAQAVSAEGYFRSNTRDKAPIDLLVVDPPRPGLTRQVREGIARMRPRQILYISCNPATQARDVGYWVNRCDYTISRAALFDLYPQTHHLESALLLALG